MTTLSFSYVTANEDAVFSFYSHFITDEFTSGVKYQPLFIKMNMEDSFRFKSIYEEYLIKPITDRNNFDDNIIVKVMGHDKAKELHGNRTLLPDDELWGNDNDVIVVVGVPHSDTESLNIESCQQAFDCFIGRLGKINDLAKLGCTIDTTGMNEKIQRAVDAENLRQVQVNQTGSRPLGLRGPLVL